MAARAEVERNMATEFDVDNVSFVRPRRHVDTVMRQRSKNVLERRGPDGPSRSLSVIHM